MSEFLSEYKVDGDSGFITARGRFTEQAEEKALDLIMNKEGLRTKAWEAKLEEALTTSDFPLLFGQILDREMIAKYRALVPNWRPYMKTGKVRDFREVTREAIYDTDQLKEVVERGEYKGAPVAHGRYKGSVKKYGRIFEISWEALINDFLNAFNDIPEVFANAVTNTEAMIATGLLAEASGPNSAFFGSGSGITDPATGKKVVNKGTRALTIENVEATLLAIAAQKHPLTDAELGLQAIHLVIPPALQLTAEKILTSTQLLNVLDSGAVQANINILPRKGIQTHINSYLPRVDTTKPNTTWYMGVAPAELVGFEFLQLTGHEAPEICMRASNKVTTAGGDMNPASGDFATDSIVYRVRMVAGGMHRDPRSWYANVPA